VLVLGAGGLGFPVLTYLGAAGVGRITIVERDSVELSNLNRQLLFSDSDLGQRKALVTEKRLVALNPEVAWRCLDRPLDAELAALECRDADLAVDCADNDAARRTLAVAAAAAGIPLVHGAVAGFEGCVATFAATGRPCFACLYPRPPAPAPPPAVLGSVVGVVGSLMATAVIRRLAAIGPERFGELLLVDLERGSFDWVEIAPRPGCKLCGAPC
jgi:molybdopterin-synthase adenylyltransferase